MMFASSVNLAIDMHFCQDKLKTISFFGKAKTCYETNSNRMIGCTQHPKLTEESEGHSINKKGCCESKSVHIQSDVDELEITSQLVISQELLSFVTAFVDVFIKNNYPERTSQRFQYYHPPIVVKDIPVLNQSFLL